MRVKSERWGREGGAAGAVSDWGLGIGIHIYPLWQESNTSRDRER
jgi:hypothetical protein